MKVISEGIKNGIILDKYGKRGPLDSYDIPTVSLPLEIKDAPKKTKSFVVIIEDKDAIPVSRGFSWIHWVAANITTKNIKENFSRDNKDIKQGLNSWISIQGGNIPESACKYYGGMTPPDKAHTYEIHVYAVDCLFNIENGYFLNELWNMMDGHILDSYTLKGKYES